MLIDLFNETWKELEDGATKYGHPFRTCSLATSEISGGIRQRTVNLRKLTKENSLLFYTDVRSTKIEQIRKNPQASTLFYNPSLQLQIFLSGIIKVHSEDSLWDDHLENIEGRSINDYNTLYAPGKPIKNPIEVTRTKDLNFAILELIPDTIEYLKLRDEPNRIRALFKLKDNVWEKTFLTP
ncbi:MAG: pyridoxamine 5'-phosphate oxidase family protein [Gillisia sp.]